MKSMSYLRIAAVVKIMVAIKFKVLDLNLRVLQEFQVNKSNLCHQDLRNKKNKLLLTEQAKPFTTIKR